jgi:PPM family protein phosphatase
MSLMLTSVAVTDLGLVRHNNEDSSFAGRRLVAVADGIGGMPAGEQASAIAITALARLEKGPETDDPRAALQAAAATANRQIREVTRTNPANDGMGTTITALLLCRGSDGSPQLGLLHVGDSRCYRCRARQLTQLTRDDTFVQSLVEHGVITAEGARTHPRRSLVTQAVQGLELTVTCEVLTPLPGDRYLLCSDGLSDVVSDREIAQELAGAKDPRSCGERLVHLALAAGAPDNVTVVVADL